MDLNPSYSVEN